MDTKASIQRFKVVYNYVTMGRNVGQCEVSRSRLGLGLLGLGLGLGLSVGLLGLSLPFGLLGLGLGLCGLDYNTGVWDKDL